MFLISIVTPLEWNAMSEYSYLNEEYSKLRSKPIYMKAQEILNINWSFITE